MDLMSRDIADKLFPNKARRKINTSGWGQVTKRSDVVDDVNFQLNGDEYQTSFIVDDNIEDIFHAQIVIGKPTFDKILKKSYGIYLKDLFDIKKVRNIRNRLNQDWLDTRVMRIGEAIEPITIDHFTSLIIPHF